MFVFDNWRGAFLPILPPPKYGRYLADHIPQAAFTLIENAGHRMVLEQPDELVTAVARKMGWCCSARSPDRRSVASHRPRSTEFEYTQI